MQISLSGRDIILLLIVLSISFFLLGLKIQSSNPEVMKVSTDRLLPIYRVDRTDNKIAITLDGMWGADNTTELLEIFRANNINITFFFGGNWLKEYPQYVKQIASEGHEIGNHSYSHPHMDKLSVAEIKEELKKTEELIKELTGQSWPLFRPPFGAYNNQLIKTCEQLDYYPIQWSIDSLDWKDVSADFIYRRIMNSIDSGDIVLMHNDGAKTPEALRRLIPDLKAEGYEIVPLSELIYQNDYYIEQHSGLQKRSSD